MATSFSERDVLDRRETLRRASDRAPRAAVPAVRDVTGMQVSWGGVWGGVMVGMGTLFLLTALGLAVGITAAEPGQTEARTLGIGAGLWASVSLLLALFIGGLVSTRIGMIHDKATGFVEGMLVWVLGMLLVASLAGSGLGLLAGGAFQIAGNATRAAGSQAGDLSSGSVDEIVQRLRDPRTAATLAAAGGRPQAEVQSQLSSLAARVESARNDPARAAAEARQGVQDLMTGAGSNAGLAAAAGRLRTDAAATAWATLAALVLSLFAAVLGALLGRRRAARARAA